MDRNQRSRRQKSVSGSYSQAPKRSMGSRMGLEKPGTPRQQPPKKSSSRSQRPTQQNQPAKSRVRPRRAQTPAPRNPGRNHPKTQPPSCHEHPGGAGRTGRRGFRLA